MKIAFQGEPGANSHIAIVEAYPDATPLPCATFEDALAAIASGEADLGMIPIENSVAGRVADIHHLLPQSGLYIVGDWFLPIRHPLRAPRGATLEGIRTVESHVHALGQCRRIIRQLAETPDGVRYLCVATEIAKGGGGFNAPHRRYAIALGCEVAHAGDFVYGDGLDLTSRAAFDPIGISCRICERRNCVQRAVPPLAATIAVPADRRAIVPYEIV